MTNDAAPRPAGAFALVARAVRARGNVGFTTAFIFHFQLEIHRTADQTLPKDCSTADFDNVCRGGVINNGGLENKISVVSLSD